MQSEQCGNTKPTVYIGYKKRECKWNNFYCNMILNSKYLSIMKYLKVQLSNDIKVIFT